MRRPVSLSRVSAVVLSLLIVPSLAAGQSPDRGPRLGGLVSGAFGTGGPAPTVAASAGYRFTPRFGVEVDASYMGGLDFGEFPACAPDVMCAARSVPAFTVIGGAVSLNGRAAMLSVNAVSEVPVRTQRLRPYIVGGVGVAEVRREQRFDSIPVRFTTTSTGPLLTMGGGVDFLLWRKVAVGIDFRYQYVFEEEPFGRPDMDKNLTVGRLGTSISYRF